MRMIFVSGYMKALEETAAPDMLEALLEYKRMIRDEGCITDFDQIKLSDLINEAINKATKP